ncbi:hypothetical protein SERLA73DRAFT_128766, partial [Serpula lacrymans var. lacrymans S7.3]
MVDYTCCPACFSTYHPDKLLPVLYPQYCTYCKTHHDNICGEPLLRSQPNDGSASDGLAGHRPLK